MGATWAPAGDELWEELGFTSIFDAYQCVVCDRDQVADDVAGLLAEFGAGQVLDCAAGTGLPALDLRSRGVDLDCSDGDPGMVDQFRRNAKRREVDSRCDVRSWSDLHRLGRRYDYVICRGNSLVYASSWLGGSRVASTRSLRENLENFAAVLRPGGVLQIDVPRSLALAPCDGAVESSPATRLVETEYEGPLHRIAVAEDVVELVDSRLWRARIEITPEHGEPYRTSFERHSSKLTNEDLPPLLEAAGLKLITERSLPSDRPSHITMLARAVS